jgi:maltodextrin utilization protein YvdJ
VLYLWFSIVGLSLWMVVGSMIMGVYDAFVTVGPRLSNCNSGEDLFRISLCALFWPVLLVFIIALLTSESVTHVRKRPYKKCVVNRDWE